MRKGGRRPAPRNLYIVRGGKESRLNDKEPQPEIRLPPIPDYLEGAEVDWWLHFAQKLTRIRVMTDGDVELVVLLAREWLHYQTLCVQTREMGPVVKAPNGALYHNPAWTMQGKALDRVNRLLAEAGLTPSARRRVETQ